MDPTERIRQHFDELGDAEWERLETTPRGRVSFEVHRSFLADFVSPGSRVLEVGAGPGRFTIAMAALGATVVVTDISPVQLELHRRHVHEAGSESAVLDRYVLDIRETDRFSDQEFDVVVAFGGPLSYVFEDARASLKGLLRVGKVVLGSVMSTMGAWRFFLPAIVAQSSVIGHDANDLIITTGDLRYEGRDTGHTCQMYRYDELEQLVTDAGGRMLAASSSNWASLGDQQAVAKIADDADAWDHFVAHEVRFCRLPGLLDGGTHILFAAQRSAMS